MRVKPKEVLVNLPVALLFNDDWEISSFAANINTILHGKVKLKSEELGKLGGRYVGLFYLQRNDEYHQIRNEFMRLIEEEELSNAIDKRSDLDDPYFRQEDLYAHALCTDCEEHEILEQKGLEHCRCGAEWYNGMCKSLKRKK